MSNGFLDYQIYFNSHMRILNMSLHQNFSSPKGIACQRSSDDQSLAMEALCSVSSLELNKKMDKMLFWVPSVNCILIKSSS